MTIKRRKPSIRRKRSIRRKGSIRSVSKNHFGSHMKAIQINNSKEFEELKNIANNSIDCYYLKNSTYKDFVKTLSLLGQENSQKKVYKVIEDNQIIGYFSVVYYEQIIDNYLIVYFENICSFMKGRGIQIFELFLNEVDKYITENSRNEDTVPFIIAYVDNKKFFDKLKNKYNYDWKNLKKYDEKFLDTLLEREIIEYESLEGGDYKYLIPLSRENEMEIDW